MSNALDMILRKNNRLSVERQFASERMNTSPKIIRPSGNGILLMIIMIMTSGWGLQQRPTSPITKKYCTLKIKIDNEAVQKLHTS